MVDTLTDNEKRAYSAVRACFSHHGGNVGNSGCAAFNFTYMGVLSFDTDKSVEEIQDALILGDVDVQNVDKDENTVEVQVTPSDLNKAREVLINDLGIKEDDFSTSEATFVPQALVKLSDEDKEKVQKLLEDMDALEDVQAVYHNADLN